MTWEREASRQQDNRAAQQDDKAALRRRGLRYAYFIIVWDVIEGIVAVTAGLIANSIALLGFGIDSGIEVFAASVTVWQLRGGAQARQRTALRLIALTFFALAAYVAYESISDLVSHAKPDPSIIGIVLNVIALIVMVPVAMIQRRTGLALDNEVLIAQSQETWISNYLSISLLVGLGANAVVGWWWADPLVALLVAGIAAYSGIEGWREAQERHD
jgi:divalent metal cation (Fe/Co/Zn/Cd) transporter